MSWQRAGKWKRYCAARQGRHPQGYLANQCAGQVGDVDRLLPVIRTVAIATDVLVEEAGGCRSGDDPGLVIKGELRLGQ